MGRPPKPSDFRRWRAVRDGRGQWIVVDEDGEQPIRDRDPMERLYAVHLAAEAPWLRDVLKRICRRMEHLIAFYSSEPNVDQRLVDEGWAAILCSRPTWSTFLAAEQEQGRRQMELELDPEITAAKPRSIRVAR